jgi:hypothetical protein
LTEFISIKHNSSTKVCVDDTVCGVGDLVGLESDEEREERKIGSVVAPDFLLVIF